MNSLTQGIHHVGLSVLDLSSTQAFFEQILGFTVVGGKPAYPAVFLSDGTTMLTLWQVEDPLAAVGFNRRTNVGLHHLALKVADKGVLARLHTSLTKRADVTVEFAPEALGNNLLHLMVIIPGGIRLELVAPAG